MTPVSAKREPCLFVFPRGKSLFITNRIRVLVGRLVFSFFRSACVTQRGSNIFFREVCRPRSTHAAPMSVPAGSVHTHKRNIFRAGGVVRRSELVELGAATCVGTWLGNGFEKTKSNHNGFSFWSSTYRNPTLRVLVGRKFLSTATLGPCPQDMLQVVF